MKSSLKSRITERLRASRLMPGLKQVRRFWRCSRLINRLRSRYTVLVLKRRIIKSRFHIKLHLGCGERRLAGFINIDLNKTSATDYVADITELNLPANLVDRVEMYHVLEHLPESHARTVLKKLYASLKPGGMIVIECPDLSATVRDFLEGNQERIYTIYGRNRFPGDAHRFGYTVTSLTQTLASLGFSSVVAAHPQDSHAAEEPCLRVEALK